MARNWGELPRDLFYGNRKAIIKVRLLCSLLWSMHFLAIRCCLSLSDSIAYARTQKRQPYDDDEDEESVTDKDDDDDEEDEDEESVNDKDDEDEDEESVIDKFRNVQIENILSYRSSEFQVFNVDLSTKTCTEIKDLGNRIIFLGHNSSFSLA
ncbi:hypothetical protein QYF36_020237 [Acer negundo]|nr:hypothetical protein QYF36_020237 [Acer negundo]